MLIQTLTKGPEKVFVVVKNGAGATIDKGQVVVWAMDTVNDGIDVEDMSAAKYPLVAGLADADIADGDYGLVQVYGLDDDAIIYTRGTATNSNIAVGDICALSSAIEGLAALNAGASLNLGGTNGAVPMFVCAETVESGGTNTSSTTTAKVFIRAL